MLTYFPKLPLMFIVVILTVFINMGCSLSFLEQSQTTENSDKLQESTLTIIDTSDAEHPTLSGSIQLPFRVNSNNNVVISGKHAYVTTDKHLHVIDISNLQQPSYITSIIFPDEIGETRISNNQVFVVNRNNLHLVDVSNPIQPTIQSTVSLHHANKIRAFDIHKSYLYLIDIYDYVHIYSFDNNKTHLVETVGLTNPFSVGGIRSRGTGIEQILTGYRTPGDISWTTLIDRTDLLELSGRYMKIRISDDDLVFASRRWTNREVIIHWGEHGNRPNALGWIENYHIEKNYFAYLYLSGKKKLSHGTPTDAYIDRSNKIQLVSQDQWSETLGFEENQLLGPITDFQISGKLLYVVSAKGFLSIVDLNPHKKHRYISGTKIHDLCPVSIAVGENISCVLTSHEIYKNEHHIRY